MSTADFAIRRATASDAAAIAEFGARVFKDWFGPDNDPADVELHVASTFDERLQRAELAASDASYLLALAAGAIVGYALLRQGSPNPCIDSPAPCAIVRFYVDRPWHGRGLAMALMDAAAANARAGGARSLWLTTWEQNPRARRFYVKAGFADVGTATFLLGRSPQIDRVLSRVLD